MDNVEHHKCPTGTVHAFYRGVNISGTCSMMDVSLLRSYIHSRLGRGTPETVTILSPLGMIVSGCPRNGARRVRIRIRPGRPRVNAEGILFKERLFIRHRSFVTRPIGGCFELFPNGRMEFGDTCFIGYINFSYSRGNRIAAIRYACSPRDHNKGSPSNEGIGKAVR